MQKKSNEDLIKRLHTSSSRVIVKTEVTHANPADSVQHPELLNRNASLFLSVRLRDIGITRQRNGLKLAILMWATCSLLSYFQVMLFSTSAPLYFGRQIPLCGKQAKHTLVIFIFISKLW